MHDFLEALTVIVTAMVKFFFAGLVSYGMGKGFWETVAYLMIGSVLGMTIFYFAGRGLLEWFRKRYIRRRRERMLNGLPPKPIFTRTNRTIVRIKGSYGLLGLAALAPPTLSIPITAVLAAKYFRHDARTLPILLSSVLVWSVILSLVWSFVR
jgi:hypothetical protein